MKHRTKRIRWPVLAAVGLLVAGSGTAYAITDEGSAGSYRTARATRGDVEQLLTTSGTVDAARRSDLEFGASGTVATVTVALGQAVKAGQVVATLETGELRAAVTRARASLARAVAQLETDENAQAQTVADAAQAPTGTRPKNGATPSGSPATAAALAALHEQQAAVIAAQSAATAALTAAREALAAQTEACKDAYQDQPSAPASDDGAAEPSEPTASSAAADNAACSSALADVQARQQDVDKAQEALAAALSALARTLSDALATLTSQPGGTGTPSGSARAPANGTTDSPASEGSESPVTGDAQTASSSAARLAADQADIEQARADLVDARQQLRQAVVRSTRSGKVRSLGVAPGDVVAAGDVAAVVVGGRAVTLEASVPESKIGQVEVGQRVEVSTPGETGTADGTVTAIGLVADTSSGTASYPVTVTVEDPSLALPTGSEAMLAIVVATAKDAVTVPTSAVTRRGDGAVVQVWDGEKLSRKAVTIGTVGARSVEITDGVEVGDQVVLADLDQEITGASDTLNDRGGPGGGPVFRVGGPGGPGGANGPGGGPVTFKSGG